MSSSDIKNRNHNHDLHQEDEEEVKRYLPTEIQTEILSRLPVESISRFKCVCKRWYNIIASREFAELHNQRSEVEYVYKEYEGEEDSITFANMSGLLLERIVSTGKYRIRNPKTKYMRDVPCPRPGYLVSMMMFYLPETEDYKLVCITKKEETSKNVRCKVLRIGTDFAWRHIGSFSESGKILISLPRCNLCFIVSETKIVCLEVEPEHFVHVKIPQGLLMNLGFQTPICWGKDSLALARMVEQDVQLWILEDYKKEIWSEMKVKLPLEWFGNCHAGTSSDTLSLAVCISDGSGWLSFRRPDGCYLHYNVNCKCELIDDIESSPGKSFKYSYTPTLFNCEKRRNFAEEPCQLASSETSRDGESKRSPSFLILSAEKQVKIERSCVRVIQQGNGEKWGLQPIDRDDKENQPCVNVKFKSLTRESRRKLELLQEWSQWNAHQPSTSSTELDRVSVSGKNTYFPAILVGPDKSSAVPYWMETNTRETTISKPKKIPFLIDEKSVPLYNREFSSALTSSKDDSNLQGMLNASSRNPTRYHQNTPGGKKYDGLKPGSLNPEIPKLLGLEELDSPPWLNKMRQIRYTPAYLAEHGEDDQPSGITILGADENMEDGEEGEILEKGIAKPDKRMTVEFPGVNAPIQEKADKKLWDSL
ncbi:OLC1v1021890C1 [Oldenlandia corymbosa var. corymbosa]|uniref:OLC1v1021890C1 n=1 Tax=Oldenlandia corymbosa var. corymbosa TaxID=529605 RepID=A0AAV1BXB0_OLDCO|nr:OLC1v1021890C1 [Oldenlandia corymbosa var. corymbosa]